MKTSRVSRVIKILTALHSGQHYAVSDLAKMLGTSRRTIFRDLKDLRKAGVPCYYDKKARSYAIDPKFFLPSPDLNTKEALGLLLLVHKVRNHLHLPFRESALWAALKVENNLASKIKRFCNSALNNITIKAAPQTEMNSLDEVFIRLMEAILKKRIVNIRYYVPSKQKNVVFDLSPYRLLYNEHAWHVVGKPRSCEQVSIFKLNRIKELNISDKCFIEDKKFDIQEYLGKAWSMLPEGRLYHVKLRFLPEVANDVADVQWHSTQTVSFEDDGSAIVEFRVDGLSEVTWWILSYGDRVQVLSPQILRLKIIEVAQNTVKHNQQLLPV